MTYQTGTWATKVKRARELEPKELERHARVSIDNRHKCENCFTCACAKVYLEKKARR